MFREKTRKAFKAIQQEVTALKVDKQLLVDYVAETTCALNNIVTSANPGQAVNDWKAYLVSMLKRADDLTGNSGEERAFNS